MESFKNAYIFTQTYIFVRSRGERAIIPAYLKAKSEIHATIGSEISILFRLAVEKIKNVDFRVSQNAN